MVKQKPAKLKNAEKTPGTSDRVMTGYERSIQKHSVSHKPGWSEILQFVNNCAGKYSHSSRTFFNTKLQRQNIHNIIETFIEA